MCVTGRVLCPRQLCVLVGAEAVYRGVALSLRGERELRFAARLVDVLDTLLLTAAELHHLRRSLRAFSDPVSLVTSSTSIKPVLAMSELPFLRVSVPGDGVPVRDAVRVLEPQPGGAAGSLSPHTQLPALQHAHIYIVSFIIYIMADMRILQGKLKKL